ncbi:RIIB lysis inhibitor [Caulobacter phage CcrColossus]|uniref:Putative rIIb-like protein n=1 Tax=Caulobacter phage CcrColossus TaxID=1211640 RepID=K4JVZ8_9CAUD|nr:RIIB lysis inhibitor [Caulobacter phage CcrColossus]AFU88048.1 putative rIIb-like protein [Caulobacter phage CcrColossus]
MTDKLPYMISGRGRPNARVGVLVNQRWRSFLLSSERGRQLEELLRAPVHDVEAISDIADAVQWVAKLSHGRVTVDETDRLRLDGKLIDYGLTGRISKLIEQGMSFVSLANFIERLSRNPDPTVAEDLYRFMEKGNLPLDEDGYLYGFKKVDDEYWSYASGENGKVQYLPGTTPNMRREDCDPNRHQTCSRGLHVCSFEYLKFWYPQRGRVMIIRVDPEHVTAIPADHDDQKLRCCELFVAGEIPEEDAKNHFKDIVDNRYRPVTEPADEIVDRVEEALAEERETHDAEWWGARGLEDGKTDGAKDANLGYDADWQNDFKFPNDAIELHEREWYQEGYEDGYREGYNSIVWTLERAIAVGKETGISRAKADYPNYDNTDTLEDTQRDSLVNYCERTAGEGEGGAEHPFVTAYDRALRDAYHTHFNAKADEDK